MVRKPTEYFKHSLLNGFRDFLLGWCGAVSTWILGGAILSKFYTVFDIKERILSIGELDADPPFLCGDPVWCLGDYSHASYNASYRCTVYKELGLSGTGIHVIRLLLSYHLT